VFFFCVRLPGRPTHQPADERLRCAPREAFPPGTPRCRAPTCPGAALLLWAWVPGSFTFGCKAQLIEGQLLGCCGYCACQPYELTWCLPTRTAWWAGGCGHKTVRLPPGVEGRHRFLRCLQCATAPRASRVPRSRNHAKKNKARASTAFSGARRFAREAEGQTQVSCRPQKQSECCLPRHSPLK
jgi:hypothetical protein